MRIRIPNFKVLLKYFLSFRKTNWNLEDYPLRYKHQTGEMPKELSRLKMAPWTVQIINWCSISGDGNTKEEAYKDLENKFNDRLKEGKQIPRPGKGLPIEYASSDGIEENIELVDDFLEKILGFGKKDPVFITDESSLWDFNMSEDDDDFNKKIFDNYGVNVDDIEDRNILKIILKIKNRVAQ